MQDTSSTAVAVAPNTTALGPVADRLKRPQIVARALAELLTADDVTTVDGKPFIKSSGWLRLGDVFGVDLAVVSHAVTRDPNGHAEITVVVEARAPWGRTVQDVGAASTGEKRFKNDKSAIHAAITLATTRARSRAMATLLGTTRPPVAQGDGGRTATLPVTPTKVAPRDFDPAPVTRDSTFPVERSKLHGVALKDMTDAQVKHFAAHPKGLPSGWAQAFAAEHTHRLTGRAA